MPIKKVRSWGGKQSRCQGMVQGNHLGRVVQLSQPQGKTAPILFHSKRGEWKTGVRAYDVSGFSKCRLIEALSHLGFRLSMTTALPCCPVLPLAKKHYSHPPTLTA